MTFIIMAKLLIMFICVLGCLLCLATFFAGVGEFLDNLCFWTVVRKVKTTQTKFPWDDILALSCVAAIFGVLVAAIVYVAPFNVVLR